MLERKYECVRNPASFPRSLVGPSPTRSPLAGGIRHNPSPSHPSGLITASSPERDTGSACSSCTLADGVGMEDSTLDLDLGTRTDRRDMFKVLYAGEPGGSAAAPS